MYIPNPYFSNIPQLGNLTLDYIFVEDGYPILFTCRNGAKIYICLCRTLSPIQKWIISETSIAILKKLAQQDIPICDAFTQLGTKSCIAQWSKANPVEKYSVISTSDLSSDDLPDKDVFLDDDNVEDAIENADALFGEAVQRTIWEASKELVYESSPSVKIKSSISYGFKSYCQLFEQIQNICSTQMLTSYVGNVCNSSTRLVPTDNSKGSVNNTKLVNGRIPICDAA